MDLEFQEESAKPSLPAPIKTRSDIGRNDTSRFDDNAESCSTPTSEEHRIPVPVSSPPPPPRKPRRSPPPPRAGLSSIALRSCKRKLMSLEVVNPEEIEIFFRSAFEPMAVAAAKRRRCCLLVHEDEGAKKV